MASHRPHGNDYGPLPGSPYGYAQNNAAMMEAMEQARIGVDGDYLGGACPCGNTMPPRSPYQTGFDQDPYFNGMAGPSEESIRK